MELHMECDIYTSLLPTAHTVFFFFFCERFFFFIPLVVLIKALARHSRRAVHQMKLFSPFWVFSKGFVDTKKKREKKNLAAIKTMNKLLAKQSWLGAAWWVVGAKRRKRAVHNHRKKEIV